jgi:hypothetical protein
LNRKLAFELTLDDFKFLVTKPCFYCGKHEKPGGVDRWDNTIGYTFENSRPCCAICNIAKQDLNGAAFVEHFQCMADHTRAVELSDLQQHFEEIL